MNLKSYLLVAAATMTSAGAFAASPLAADVVTDPFYSYTGSLPLSSVPLGTVFKTRNVVYHVEGIPLPVIAQQLLYRTNNAQNQAVVNVTSVIKSPVSNGHAISYQSAYDSLNPHDEPSQVIAGNLTLGGLIYSGESIPVAALLLLGYNIIVPDTEGQTADFAVGAEEGMTTLDSIRAALNTPSTGLGAASRVAMIGYSGGAIGTDWAAQLAPTYAPDVNKHLVGAAFGGLLIDPIHNVTYVDGSVLWGGVAAAALGGFARGYGIDPTPYLSSAGVTKMGQVKNGNLITILPFNLGMVWQPLIQPQYVSDYNNYMNGGGIGGFTLLATLANQANAGLIGSPTIPVYFDQGNQGWLDGTFYPEPGDGVMLADDARTLSRQFCASGTRVQYNEIPLEHASTALVWAVGILPWLNDRFAGKTAPSNCGMIPSGRSLAAVH